MGAALKNSETFSLSDHFLSGTLIAGAWIRMIAEQVITITLRPFLNPQEPPLAGMDNSFSDALNIEGGVDVFCRSPRQFCFAQQVSRTPFGNLENNHNLYAGATPHGTHNMLHATKRRAAVGLWTWLIWLTTSKDFSEVNQLSREQSITDARAISVESRIRQLLQHSHTGERQCITGDTHHGPYADRHRLTVRTEHWI